MKWIVFDVDGVLVDVTESFDLSVKFTVEYFLKKFGKFIKVDVDLIRKLRIKGRFNDDFKLSEALIDFYLNGDAEELVNNFPEGKGIEWVRKNWGNKIDNDSLINVFNTFYLGGESSDSLWKNEKSIVDVNLLKEAGKFYKIGIITGRNRKETALAERIVGMKFENKITREDGEKPDPFLLYLLTKNEDGFYIGDTTTDKMLVLNYNKAYHRNFGFYIVNGTTNVNKILEELIHSQKAWEF